MKIVFSLITALVTNPGSKHNLRMVLRFTLAVIALIALYSVAFHWIMEYEGRDFSALTGLYWSMTVMTTLGFGDITFNSDLGRVFTIVVLVSGILLLIVMLPVIFIRFIYQPWLDAQSRNKVKTSLPEDTRRHVLLVGTDDTARTILQRLAPYQIPAYLITPDHAEAEVLFDQGLPVLRGELDSVDTYLAARAREAALVLALRDDLKNTNIAATVSESAPDTLLAGSARNENSVDILHYAGCKHVFQFAKELGAAIGRRVFAGKPETNIIARFEELCIAEVPARDTRLAGKSLIELDLRSKMDLNVVGIWQGTEFMVTRPDTIIDQSAVLLLSGTADKLEQFDREAVLQDEKSEGKPVLILGGGKVGQELTRSLERRKVPFRLVDKNPSVLVTGDDRYILGDAEDISVLRRAGIDDADSVAITTHNDDLNIYLTLYCRKLRPDAQIISRCNLSRNIKSLYNAGANLVMASSSMASNAVINLISPDSVYMLTEGLYIFRVDMPPSLLGADLRHSDIRRSTDCNVVAMRRRGTMLVSLDPDSPFEEDDELILVGSLEAEAAFMKKFPPKA